MSLVPSLLQAIVHVDGEALVMHAGDKPYVVSPTGQVELATRGLALDAVNGIVSQLLPAEMQQALDEFGAVQHELAPLAEFPGEHFTIVAARGGDDLWVEIRRRRIPDDDRIPDDFFAPPEVVAAAQPYPVYASAASPSLAGSNEPLPDALELESPSETAEERLDTGLDVIVEMPLYEPVASPVEHAVEALTPIEVIAESEPEPELEPEPEPAVAESQATIERRIEERVAPPWAELRASASLDPQMIEPLDISDAIAPPEPEMTDAPMAFAVAREADESDERDEYDFEHIPVEPSPRLIAPLPIESHVEHDFERPAASTFERPAVSEIERPVVSEVERPVVSEVERPVERAVERPVEAVVERPAVSAVERLVESVVERPAVTEVERPVVNQVERPIERGVERPVVNEVERPIEHAVERPIERAVERPVVSGVERPVVSGVERPVVSGVERPVVSAIERPGVVLPLARNPIRAEQPPPPADDPTMSGLDRLLRLSAARGASTLYLSSDSRPSVRVDGELQTLEGEPVLTARDVESLLLTLMPERNHEALRTGAATEWILDIEDVGRVRCMSFRDHRGPGGVFRLMPTRSVSADQLGLSRAVQSLAMEPEGLILVAGPRSSGKRTLISAFADLINRTRRDHVVTIEREINIVHERGLSFISQREVRGSERDVLAAARAALREDPDVLVIEDLRSAEMMNVALEASASGHLVIGGFAAHTATAAVDRIIDLYAPDVRRQVQLALADSLRGVVVQVLLKKTGGGRVAARELLLNTPAVSSVIAEGKTSQLPMAIEGGRRYGMMPLNDALVGLVQQGMVDGRDAYRYASDRQGFVASLKHQGVDTSFVERLA